MSLPLAACYQLYHLQTEMCSMSPFSVFPITFLLSSPYRLLDHFIQLLMTLWLHIPHTTLYWPVSLVYAIPFTWNSLPLLLWKIASLSVSSEVPLSMTFEHSLALWTVSQDQCALQVYKPWLKRGLECVLMLCFHCWILTSNFQGFFVQKFVACLQPYLHALSIQEGHWTVAL